MSRIARQPRLARVLRCARLRRLRSVALALLLLVVLGGCGSGESSEAEQAAVRPVKLLRVGPAEAGAVHRYPAVVEAAKTSDLAFLVGGQLQELVVTEAQQVASGALMARLDDRDYAIQAASARAEFENAEAAYERALRLLEGDAIAESAVEQRKSRFEGTRAMLDSAQKALDDTVLHAPYAGVVAKIHAQRFQNVQPNEKILTLIGAEGGFEATVNLPAAVIATSGARAGNRAFVIFDAAPAVRIPAEYREAVLEAVSESQTYEVRFSFQPPDDLVVLPGMSATVELESAGPAAVADGDRGAGVAVPLASVASDGDRNFVWVIDLENMTASKRWIDITPGIGETAVVIDGLEAGETIAGAGAAYLAEGMKVRPWTD